MIHVRSMLFALLAVFAAIGAGPAEALVVSADDPHFGTGSITVDLNTGYEWLSPQFSRNRSIEDVSSQFGPGGDFAGFRYATQDELIAFWQSAGLTIGFGNAPGPYEAFLSLMGGPTETGGPYGTSGRIVSSVSTQIVPGSYYAPDMGIFFGSGFANPNNCCVTSTQTFPQSGSWLLRVPNTDFSFTGFFAPIENPPVVNSAKAGQTVPAKWQLSLNGVPVSDPSSFVHLSSYPVDCGSLTGNPDSAVDEYAVGASGLQYLGDGVWQFNWKTPKSYANTCRIAVLTLSDGSTHTATFKFK